MKLMWLVLVGLLVLLGACHSTGLGKAPAPQAEPAAEADSAPEDRTELEEKKRRIAKLEIQLYELQRNYALALQALDDHDIEYFHHPKLRELMILPPIIDATVAAVDPELNIIILSAGRKDGVRRNYEFTVYRGDKYVGKVLVEEVEEDSCSGYSRKELQAGPIEKGDTARTRW